MKNIGNPYCRTATNTWFVKIDGKAKQLGKKGATEEEARREWEKLKILIDAENTAANMATESKTVASYVTLYLTGIFCSIAQSTFTQKRNILNHFVRDHGSTAITAITPATIRAWVEGHQNWNATSQAVVYKVLNAFWVRLSENDVNYNPVKGVLNKPTAGVRGENILIPDAEYFAVLDASKMPYKAIWQILYHTGARPSEILSLTAEEVDLQRCEIVKVMHKTARKGKDRVILLPAAIMEVMYAAVATHPSGLLFRSIRGKQISASYLAGKLLAIKEKLGFTSKWTPYSYRHAFCVRHLERVKDIYTIAGWLGNTVAVCEKHYAKAIVHARSTRHLLDE